MPMMSDNAHEPNLAEAVCTFAMPQLLSDEMGVCLAEGGLWEGKSGLALSAVISVSVSATFAVGC